MIIKKKKSINKFEVYKRTRSKLNWDFPFCEKYDQIKEPSLKYTIFLHKIQLLNIFLCLYHKENYALTAHIWSYFSQNEIF
jgi:hypothetical protein